MKRSDALAPLSRDHHHALVVARDLIRAPDGDLVAAAARFVQFLTEHELSHFALEESVLVPVVPGEAPGPELTRRMREDHEFLRDALRRMTADPHAIEPGALRGIGTRLRAHVQMEEHELFPYLEQSLSETQLDDVGVALRAAHVGR